MSIKLEYAGRNGFMKVTAEGKLVKEDYERFVPDVEKRIEEQGKLNLLLVLRDFHGWTAGALWQDIKFDVKHFNDIQRLAVVGDRRWQKGMAAFCKPFTTAEVRFFEPHELDEASGWVGGSQVTHGARETSH